MPILTFDRARRPIPEVMKTQGDFMFNVMNRNWTPMGGACHQDVSLVPVTGWCLVSLVYEAPGAMGSWEVNSYAVAGGRNWNEIEPKNPDGTPVVWATGGPMTVTAGSGVANTTVETVTPPMLVFIPPDATYPTCGALYCRSKNTTALAGYGRGPSGSNGNFALIGSASPRWKKRYEYAASSTPVNSDTFVLTSSPDLTDGNRNISAFQVRITPLGKQAHVIGGGDSRMQGDTASGNLWSWLPRSCEAVSMAAKIPVGYECVALSGTSHAVFHAMMMDRLAKTGRALPDIAVLQAFSSNGSTWTDSDISAAMNRNLAYVALCKKLGIVGALVTPYPSVTATTTAAAANWRKGSQAVLDSKIPCFDFYSRAEFSDGAAIPGLPQNTGINGDAAHLNNTGHQLAAQLIGAPTLRRLLGV